MENLEKTFRNLPVEGVCITLTSPGRGTPPPFDSVEALKEWADQNPGREIVTLVYACRDQSGVAEYIQQPSGAIVDDNGEYVVIRVMFGRRPVQVLREAIEVRKRAHAAREPSGQPPTRESKQPGVQG